MLFPSYISCVKENKIRAICKETQRLGSWSCVDGVPHPWGNGLLALVGSGLGVGMLDEEGELCLSSSPSSHDSYDIGVVQSAVCNSSKLKITFIKCLVTQEYSPY